MSDAPARPFVSVKFTPIGRTYSFLLPELDLDNLSGAAPMAVPGDQVVVQTEAGPAVGTVTRVVPAMAAAPAAGGTRGESHPPGDERGRRRALQARAARARGPARLRSEDQGAQPGDEAGPRRAVVRRVAADLLLHGRGARGLPRAGAGSGRPVPHPDRDAADRRSRRSADARRLRLLRPSAVLHHLAARPSSRCRSRWRSSRISASIPRSSPGCAAG